MNASRKLPVRMAMALTAVAAVATGVAGPATAEAPNNTFGAGSPIIVANADGSSAARCTLGAVIHKPNGTDEGVTAGHCGAVGATVRDPADQAHIIGMIVDSRYNGTAVGAGPDIARISFARSAAGAYSNSWKQIATTDLLHTATGFQPDKGAVDSTTLSETLASVVPPTLCINGATSGTSCGTLQSVDLASNRFTVAAPSAHGDSGAPVYEQTPSGAHLIGILVAAPAGGGQFDAMLLQPYAQAWDWNLTSTDVAVGSSSAGTR